MHDRTSAHPSPGRHRQRRPHSQPNPDLDHPAHRDWDGGQKARAAHLDLLEPGWLVLYGPYHRRFYAIARTAAVTEPLVQATTIDGLRTLMRESESEAAAGMMGARAQRGRAA
ncbi:hypothetical protein Ssi03_36390 [Sphaerisporangium siamense]|uniref:Uncharacterized protein n=1 Tax=Sphaerisporangium siamense TaxID=795645 RepID=A0A7W7D7P1_9ACTN|nr:hypothetical protein [Sphaerisporangium siamense]MBB4701524.1 hypothetical protein [Sphaerisporangium siamense]GII85649.1 hypothetical protein Ssi03_36390 [Sphaerisporangium siamense]